MMTETYNIDPINADTDADEECQGCGETIRWSGQYRGGSGLHFYVRGTCQCGEWTRHTDEQNRPGETWYSYSVGPFAESAVG